MKKMSPLNLLQEIYRFTPHGEWKVLMSCIFLNQTTRKQVDRIRDEFFLRWPSPEAASKANPTEMSSLIEPLGLKNRRTQIIIRMSREFAEGNWKEPKELYGIGQYGQDSWDIFIRFKLNIKKPSDKVLTKYLKWAKNERKLENVR